MKKETIGFRTDILIENSQPHESSPTSLMNWWNIQSEKQALHSSSMSFDEIVPFQKRNFSGC